MQNAFSGSDKEKALTFAYKVGSGVYINLTNRCTNDCEFCIRRNGAGAYGSDPLWLEREPTAEEAAEAALALADANTKEFVFCGYGEPACRADALIETAKILKARRPDTPVRINTNGQADLIFKKDIVPDLVGLV
ncbi:MAG: radical SAM protein, partial [Clostridia bacterium]|nr:radical SAM protein [Clostridia bacterium]